MQLHDRGGRAAVVWRCSHNPTPYSPPSPHTAGVLVVGTALRHLASLPKFRSMPGVETVPAMVGMCVGWAFGDGCVQLLAELRRDHPSWCEPALYEGGPPDCHTANLLASVLLTLVAAVLIVGIQPWSKNVELGDGPCVDAAEDLLEEWWGLVAKALATSVMVLWTFALSDLEMLGLPPGQVGADAWHEHMRAWRRKRKWWRVHPDAPPTPRPLPPSLATSMRWSRRTCTSTGRWRSL